MSSSQALTAQMHTIIRTTIAQYYVNQAVKRGVARQQAQPGSVTFIQRFGGALNLHVHFHGVFLEDVYLDRAEAGLKPRFVKGEPPSAADIAEVCSCGPGDVAQTISRRVIRKLRHLGYLEAGSDAAGSTGYDPLMVDEPALAHTLATSVTQRMALGERAGQQVRLMGSGFGYAGERSARTGSRCASVHGFSLHATAQVPAPRRDQLERLMRYTARGAVALERLEDAAHGASCTRSQNRGLTGQPALPSRLWNSWRSWRRWYRCRASSSCGMAAVWRHTAAGAAR
jgi:hypothetical protein